ncbi:MAG TPA: DUF6036 family nucleotidyltransferase [Rhodoferax sp.]|nr:DUF6036 family nucleotidyltransferase [Rhodoferax sp.]
MNIDVLMHLLSAAQQRCGHRDYVVIGSLSVLGMAQVDAIPPDMTLSIDADCYTLTDPPRVFDLADALGEGSPYHQLHGVYLDPVSPFLPTLPSGWERRLIKVTREPVTAHFLEPNDAAISKLARGEPRDLRWVRAGLKASLVSLPVLRLRVRNTTFLDAEEQTATVARLDELKAD